ncbi:MAG: DUF4928 family protein [Betaproteobacteria bacterium]|nr:DUF4928 family protein [Betaproteobacteria bacterium]
MNGLTFFRVGERYTNDQIRFSLDLENLGGIRPSIDARRSLTHLAILTADDEISEFSTTRLRKDLYRLLSTYNDRISAVEADKSLLIEIPQNLSR